MDFQAALPPRQPPNMNVALATVAYADIFDYPLTQEELTRWMIFGGGPPKQKKEYYFLSGRDHLVAVRQKRAAWQREKWAIARSAANILSKIPTVRLVGVTGGLAMNNAKKEDDIDLFIVTSEGWLWTSRLLATILMDFFGLRRRPNEMSVANKICLNMFTSELAALKSERDLFSAHEVLQMEPIFDRKNTYKKFLQANRWASKFLPNAWRYRYDY